jgi:tRNA(Ile)-lysidine synthase
VAGSRLIRSLAEQVKTEDLFARNARIVVGVSGGADSMALLYALLGLNREAGYALSLHIAHLDHRLRGEEAEKDAAFVQAAADHLELPCTVERLDPDELTAPASGTVEEAARRRRYEFFAQVCERWEQAHLVAVGHQADDAAETILHRIVRGTGWRGLAGIPRCRSLSDDGRIMLVRPLLRFTRRELMEFLSAEGVPHREDRTNVLNEPTRNRIRNVVLPLLRSEVNPQVHEALVRLGEQARWLDEFLSETVDKTFDTLVVRRTDQELVLNAMVLAHKSRILQAELIRRAIHAFRVGEQGLSFSHLTAVMELLGDRPSGRQVHLPAGMTVARAYDRLIFSLPTDRPREDVAADVTIRVPGDTVLALRRMQIQCRLIEPTPREMNQWRQSRHTGEEWLDAETVHLPLTVRSRREGDRFWPLGAPGTKKLSDFLIDAKVSAAERASVALLCDRLGPVWVIGYRIDDRVKLTSITRRVLHVRVNLLSESD